MSKLTTSAVEDIFKKCLFTEGEDTSNAMIVEGINMKFGFHPGRLEENKAAIRELLYELPDEFIKGGGWTFLNACVDKEGNQWGEHRNIEQLLCLGLATKQAGYVMTRDYWNIFPGGMPYIFVGDVKDKTEVEPNQPKENHESDTDSQTQSHA
jgi:hypothetical protein